MAPPNATSPSETGNGMDANATRSQSQSSENTGPAQESNDRNESNPAASVPRPKRIACVICRKRKLRCDGSKPSCGTCSRLGHECAYDEYRRKSGPKRGYVKALEKRLAQVESQLKTQDVPETSMGGSPDAINNGGDDPQASQAGNGFISQNFSLPFRDQNPFPGLRADQPSYPSTASQPALNSTPSWEMTSLGIEEPLPPSDVVDELTNIFFEKAYPSVPMIHRRRYMAATSLPVHAQPPICLRYAMWALAASVADKYQPVQEYFYQLSRKYIELDEMRGVGERLVTIAHSQTWTMLATFEFKMMYFPRAWMSIGRSVRLALMMGLHRMDGSGVDVKQSLAPARDWTEEEERRRTFWGAFCSDRYASIGTGWPMTIEEKDVLTNLPASEEAYDMSRKEQTYGLAQALNTSGASRLSPFGGVVVMACLFGRNIIHLHRPDTDNRDDDLNGDFWKRHRQMDNLLANTALSLPDHLKLASGLQEPNIVWTHMNIHTSIICLHQAALFKAEKNGLSEVIAAESRERCLTAAYEITHIMRRICHLDISNMNPFISFCLYVAARVFAQTWKIRPDDELVMSSMGFLLTAMNTLRKKHPLTESFLVQLDLDLEGIGMDHPRKNAAFAFTLKKGVSEISLKKPEPYCATIANPRETPTEQIPEDGPGVPLSTDANDFELFNQVWSSSEPSDNLPNRLKPQQQQQQQYPMQGGSPLATNNMYSTDMKDSGQAFFSADMDLSPDNSGSPSTYNNNSTNTARRAVPQYPSPSNSNSSTKYTSTSGGAASAHTSYTTTPPDQQDDFVSGGAGNHTSDSNGQPAHFYPRQAFSQLTGLGGPGATSDTNYTDFTPTSGHDQDLNLNNDTNQNFVMPSDWGLTGSQMPPVTDGMFSQILGMGWDDTAAAAAATGRIVSRDGIGDDGKVG